MARQNTGYARMKTLTVTKGDYSKSYNITDAFTPLGGQTYPALTDSQFAELEQSQYSARLEAFLFNVCSLEPGLESDCPGLIDGAVVWDPMTCPLTIQGDR